jgi:Lipopolysaccharide biosynthesis proteins, LPS:glycosyltransferases
MNICLIYSPNWKQYISVELFSLFKNNAAPIRVYLVSDKDGYIETDHITNYFGEGYDVEFIDLEKLYNERIPSKINVDSRFTKYALYRLLLPEVIHDDKLLYIDADAIVSGDISELYNSDISSCHVIGAMDIGADRYNLKKPLGLKPYDIYINAGVMLMNLKKIREDKVNLTWVKEANSKLYAAHDQCIINKTCKGKIGLMSNKYNCSISTGLDLRKEDIKIMHYAGAEKPWDTNNVPNPRFWYDAVREYKKVFEVNT